MITKISIQYSIEFLTPFHFGTGLSSGTLDRLVRRDAKGYLVIPATTIKGVLREKVENLIKIFKKFEFLSDPFVNISNKKEHLDFFRGTSVVDRIFGSPKYEGTLYFDDLKMSEMSQELVNVGNTTNPSPADYLQTQQRTQTRLMRKTKTVASGALFKSEYGNAELKFKGRIYGQLEGIQMRASDIPVVSYELFFLLSALRMTDKIGGNKSIGMGNIELKISALSIHDKEFELNQILSDEMWDIVELKFFEEDKQYYKEEVKNNEN